MGNGNGIGDGEGNGTGLGIFDFGGTGSGFEYSLRNSNGFFRVGEVHSDSNNNPIVSDSSKSLRSGLSGLIGGGGSGDNSVSYEIKKVVSDVLEDSSSFFKYVIIVLAFIFLIIFGYYMRRDKILLK
jgi:hypothetical protein